MSRMITRWLALVAAVLLAHPGAAQACSVCYGEPDSPASKGLTWAITALAFIVVGVLSAVVAFFVHAGRNGQPLMPGDTTNP